VSLAAQGWLVGIVGAVESESAVEPGSMEHVAEKERAAGDAGIAAVVALAGNGEQPVADIVVAEAAGIGAGLEDIVAAAELGGSRAAALGPASCDAAPE